MKVLKFGGTSVGSAQRIKNVASIICDQEQKIVVLSAMAGTTNSLVEISECFHKKDPGKANAILSALEQAYVNHIEELYQSDTYKERAMQYMLERSQHVWSFSNMPFSMFDEKEILVQGELISTFLMTCYLEEQGVKVVLLPALNFMRITMDNEPDMEYIAKHLNTLLEQNKEAEIYITQGFICRNAYGSIDNLERGGSDYTASLIGAAIQAEEIQIWTDIDGMVWKENGSYTLFTADTRDVRSPDNRTMAVTPPWLCGDHIDRVILKDIPEGSTKIIRLTPVNMVCHYTYEVNGLRGLDRVADLRAALSGMSGSLNMSGDSLPAGLSESLLFDGMVSRNQIIGGFYTFGHSALEGEPNVFRLYLKNRSGSMSVLEQDVSDQVHDVPVAGHVGDVHLVLNFDYEVPSEPGNGGPGFDVDVDDWDDVNVDIVL